MNQEAQPDSPALPLAIEFHTEDSNNTENSVNSALVNMNNIEDLLMVDKRHHFSKEERRVIRSVYVYFTRFLKECEIRYRETGKSFDKSAATMTREATGVRKTTLYNIINEFEPKNKRRPRMNVLLQNRAKFTYKSGIYYSINHIFKVNFLNFQFSKRLQSQRKKIKEQMYRIINRMKPINLKILLMINQMKLINMKIKLMIKLIRWMIKYKCN